LDFDDIERILELMRQHELAEFELEREGLKLRVRKNNAGLSPVVAHGSPGAAPMVAAPTMPPLPTLPTSPMLPMLSNMVPLAAPAPQPAASADDDAAVDLAVVKSPIVGTFYRSPEPGAASFVEIGERVKKDQVLCIIEAMKLMNEITSEYEGEIATVYVENGQPVQYGERLFAIRTG
jgi:acetyl-CoA carboxylase biotin carboxyl carrier protein